MFVAQLARPEKNRHASLSREKWLLPLKLCLIVGVGFSTIAALSYRDALRGARQEAKESVLPLAVDAISSELSGAFTRPVLFASGMAANTFINSWQEQDEQPVSAITNYLKAVQKQFNTTTAFFVSARTKHYYHPEGVIKTLSPQSSQDSWFYRLRSLDRPYEVNLDRDTAQLSRQTVFVNYKFLNQAGEFTGAIGVGHSTDVLSALIRRSEKRHGIHVLLLDPAGRTLSLDKDQRPSLNNIQEVTGIGQFADEIRSSPESNINFYHNGTEYFLRSKLIPELGWHLVVTTPVNIADGLFRTTLVQISITGLICLTLVLFLVYRATANHHGRLAQIACTDPLTGALNRHSFSDHMRQIRARCRREDTPLAVALLDIDHFKQINDRLGHPAGDAVLQGFADAIRRSIGERDLLFRWGGEEFLLLLPDKTIRQATEAVERIGPELEHQGIATAEETVHVRFSGGVTVVQPGDSTKTLLERADRALYKAKHGGRNQTVGL